MTNDRFRRCGRLLSCAVAVLVCTSGCGSVVNYDDPTGPLISELTRHAPEYRGTELIVVSYNIELGERIAEAIEIIETDSTLRRGDIFLLQEMSPSGVEQIARHFGLNFLYYPSAVHVKNGDDYGNAILSRWPLEDPQKIMLPHRDPLRGLMRTGTSATVVVGERRIRVISTHTEMYRLATWARLEQVDSLARSVDSSTDYAIIGGDFNTVRTEVLKQFDQSLERAGFRRATAGLGRTAESDPFGVLMLSLDHIYTRGFLTTHLGKVTRTAASDHYPIWVAVRFAQGS